MTTFVYHKMLFMLKSLGYIFSSTEPLKDIFNKIKKKEETQLCNIIKIFFS